MAINLRSTGGLSANGVKMLVYGNAGSGKTSLIPTLPNPIVLSAEGGLLSIQAADVPFIEINSMAALMEAYTWLTESAEAKRIKHGYGKHDSRFSRLTKQTRLLYC